MQRRLERFDAKLAQSGLDALLVTGQKNIYYLTDFWGTNATVFITKNRRLFLTDSRYILIAKQSVHGFDIIESKDPLKDIVKIIEADKLETIGFDNQVSFAYYQGLQAIFEGYTLSPQSNFMEELRMIKDEKELATIRKACSISDRAFTDVLDFIKPGQTTELQVANFLDFRMREYGASGVSFESIIASGYRSAMPHGVASDKVIEEGDVVTLDFGCYYQGYSSDMTRTIAVGSIDPKLEEIYHVVLDAHNLVNQKAKAGMTGAELDAIARDYISEKGYGQYFGHSLGHGVGLDIHEAPGVNAKNDQPVEVGMVITNEPGIYIEGLGGVRIEDDLVVHPDHVELLNRSPKELIILEV